MIILNMKPWYLIIHIIKRNDKLHKRLVCHHMHVSHIEKGLQMQTLLYS